MRRPEGADLEIATFLAQGVGDDDGAVRAGADRRAGLQVISLEKLFEADAVAAGSLVAQVEGDAVFHAGNAQGGAFLADQMLAEADAQRQAIVDSCSSWSGV